MATPPDFTSGAVLTAAQMNAVGLWLVKTQTVGTAVSSVAVTGAFSADYDNYLVLLSGGTMSATADIGIQLGASTTGYFGFMCYGVVTSGTVQGAPRNNTAVMSWQGGCTGAGQAAQLRSEILGPFKAAYTGFPAGNYRAVGVDPQYGTMVGEHRVATSYTGFTLLPSSGTMTGGTIRIYGYRN
jgi:hypothetical protein